MGHTISGLEKNANKQKRHVQGGDTFSLTRFQGPKEPRDQLKV